MLMLDILKSFNPFESYQTNYFINLIWFRKNYKNGSKSNQLINIDLYYIFSN